MHTCVLLDVNVRREQQMNIYKDTQFQVFPAFSAMSNSAKIDSGKTQCPLYFLAAHAAPLP